MATSPIISCEFFPPKTDKGVHNILQVQADLAVLNPAFYSVTFGAGGSTQDNTLDAVVAIQQRAGETGIDAAPHFPSGGASW